jgi:hypothetical protein
MRRRGCGGCEGAGNSARMRINLRAQVRSRSVRRACTSSQGMRIAIPASMDAARRSISSRHACSASGSTSASRLSRRESAKAARASEGSARASWKISAASRGMRIAYLLPHVRREVRTPGRPVPTRSAFPAVCSGCCSGSCRCGAARRFCRWSASRWCGACRRTGGRSPAKTLR